MTPVQQVPASRRGNLDVVKPVARGRTKRGVAEHLIVAKSTADRHVSDILSKPYPRTRL